VHSILKPAKSALWVIFLFSTLINLLLLSSPLYMLQVFDRVLSSQSLDTLFWLTLIVLAAILTLSLVDYLRHQIANRIGLWIGQTQTQNLLHAGLQETATGPNKTRLGQLVRDLGTLRQFISSPGFLALNDLPLTPIFIFVTFLLHPVLGLLAVASGVIMFVLAVLEERLGAPLVATTNFQLGRVYGDAERASRSSEALVAMGFSKRYSERWFNNYRRLINGQNQLSSLSAKVSSASRFVRLVLQIAAMGLGAYLVIHSEITPGAMIAGSTLISRTLGPIEQGISAWRGYLAYRQARRRLTKSADLFEEQQRKVTRPKPKGLIDVENLSYVVPGGAEFLFKGVNFQLAPGQSLGLVGPTGSGKSTLVRIILGLVQPTAGYVRIDATDVSTWESDDLGRHFGYVPQVPQMLNGSVRENIARFADVALSEVIKSAELAGVHRHILKLPQGYETPIHDAENILSAGELQRISLARAFFGSPSIVVLDEPNANLDPEGENALIRAISELKKLGTTVILISHRANLLRSADKVLMFQNGMAEMVQGNAPAQSTYGYVGAAVASRDKATQVQPKSVSKVRRIRDAEQK